MRHPSFSYYAQIGPRVFDSTNFTPPTIDTILTAVSETYQITINDIKRKCRRAECVEPRQVAMWFARIFVQSSYPDLGRHFERDHTTVMSGVAKIETLRHSRMLLCARLASVVDKIERATCGGAT